MKKGYLWGLVVLALCAVLAPGCGSDDDNPAGPGGGGDVFSCSIDGSAWNAFQYTVTLTVNTSDTVISITAMGQAGVDPRSFTILIVDGGVGTHNVSPSNSSFMTYTDATGLTPDVYSTEEAGGSGAITITSLASNRIEGTFNFVGVEPVASGTATITNGVINLPFTVL